MKKLQPVKDNRPGYQRQAEEPVRVSCIAYKLMTRRKDGSLGPLFINRPQRLELGTRYKAEVHGKKGYKLRPGWHCCPQPTAPHLKDDREDRVWVEVEIEHWKTEHRPSSQGGLWYLANYMTPLRIL